MDKNDGLNHADERGDEHVNFMRLALEEARKALEIGEVPVGAVIVKDGIVVGNGHNLTETAKDPTAHAEIIALRKAAETLGGWRLPGCVMYVTTEPCSMCAGAIVLSRMPRLFIGTMDRKAGACGSVYNIVSDSRLNHRVETETGLLAEECGLLMKEFFKELRKKKQ